MDNSPSLHALVKGASGNKAMDRAVALVYIMCFILQCTTYFEYVDSDSNFSDGISRECQEDTWTKSHAIATKVMTPRADLWTDTLATVWMRLEEEVKESASMYPL